MSRSQRHKVEEQGFSSSGRIYEEGAINDQIVKSLGLVGDGIEAARPVLSSISPTTAAVGASSLTLTCTGTGFTTGNCVIMFKGAALVTTFVSATSLTAPLLPVTYGVGTHQVQVVKGGSLPSSATKPFIITA